MSTTSAEALTDVHGEDEPLSVAFVGQGVYFEQCALEQPAAGVEPHFVDFRAGAPAAPLLARLQELDADVVLVFRPEIVPERLFTSLRAITVGYLTEPLPRRGNAGHPDLSARLAWLEKVDAANFDRVVSFDPIMAETAERVLPVWRSLPIPVADSMFGEVHERGRPPRLLFVGRSTEHREALLEPVKARWPIVHIGHGLHGAPLLRLFARSDVQLNLHNHPYPTFENRVCIALAAGHLVITEPLSPDHGLSAGEHLLQAADAASLASLVEQLAEDREAFAEVQLCGRAEAERFRASRVYPRLLREAVQDVAEHGGRRERDAA